jgi:hypothetical protein
MKRVWTGKEVNSDHLNVLAGSMKLDHYDHLNAPVGTMMMDDYDHLDALVESMLAEVIERQGATQVLY